jgi:3-oxoacyl-[acyl-carrier protein] reductase
MDLHLQDKVAFVTGGARGLGQAICCCLAAEGAHVAVNYRRHAQDAEQLASRLQREHGVKAIALQGDVASGEDVTENFDACVQQLGLPDVLINNAGVWPKAYVHEMTEEAWDQTFAVNLKGAFLTCREAVRRWIDAERGGRIVNVSSSAAFIGSTTGHAHYAASKAGLVNFTVSLAREVASRGIYVNAVAPGMMRTDMAQEALTKNEDKYLARIPLKRIGHPDEVAKLIVFLASDCASYSTGATMDASGGLLMR